MINRVQYSLSFQKKLVAKVDLPSRNGVQNCSIYELDKGKKDAKRISKQLKQENWEYTKNFLESLNGNLPNFVLNSQTFSIEDNKEYCLGLVNVYDFGFSKNINFIEVNPKYQHSKGNRSIKNIGETLIAFLLKNWKGKNFVVLHPVDEALDFYKKVGFTPMELPVLIESPCYLNNEKLSETLKRNEQKIGTEIELVGEND